MASTNQQFIIRLFAAAMLFFAPTQAAQPASTAEQAGLTTVRSVSFNRDIRPLLSDRCFLCHGPDDQSRQAELRLDIRDAAIDSAIVAGDAEASELIARIISEDPDLRMPPADSNKPLFTAKEIDLLKHWIDEGASYEKHWAFVVPALPEPPKARLEAWDKHPIDRLVLRKLDELGWEPSPCADRRTLLRRASLDLTGLPPTRKQISTFLTDDSPEAWSRAIDSLLASPAYGEHQARYWLDAARYADSNGYQYDFQRDQWAWRDWVIHAFNDNKPYDEFTIEQLAGDLLPEATQKQKLATGYNRNHPITVEGGIIDEEYRVEYVIDRTTTMGTTWLGLTLGCARCHDHKYDPISQREFYQLTAFFNQVPERGMKGFEPQEPIPSPFQEPLVESTDERIRALELQLAEASDAESPKADEITKELDSARKLREELLAAIPKTMIMRDIDKPRGAYVLERGEYDKRGEHVQPGTPTMLPPMTDDLPRNRLGLARWLTSSDHPLTSRVAVNRFWQQLFGTGLHATPEDFGLQSSVPEQPELLDWLAVEFVKSDWDVKLLLKTIIMSQTYQQSSWVADDNYTRDPRNLFLARGPRERLDAETIRDSALAVSGLLNVQVGGPSVFPYHPQGLWMEVNNRPGYSSEYKQDSGDKLYRRSLYTFWKRTVPPPSMAVFDAPSREYCQVQRSSTNTPLQAFVLLHDPQFVEAARALATRIWYEGGNSLNDRIRFAVEVSLGRQPTAEELQALSAAYREQLASYREAPDKAKALLAIGDSPRDHRVPELEHAALTSIARLILNLSEFITKG